MTKFVCVKDLPETIDLKKDMIVDYPNFIEDIKLISKREPTFGKRKLTTANYLKDLVNTIGLKYDENFNVFAVPFSKFEGIEFEDYEDLSKKVIVPIFEEYYEYIFSKILEKIVTNRKKNIEMIYYTGPYKLTGAFTKYGLVQITAQEYKKSLKDNKKENQEETQDK